MKLFWTLTLALLVSFSARAQSAVAESTTEVLAVIDEQYPDLETFSEQLDKNQAELDERSIVLKYHKGNKEVTDATNEAIRRIEEYNNAAKKKVVEFESRWYDQMKNLIRVYTRYGELRESTGGGATDLDDFVQRHQQYMDLMEAVQTDLDLISADCAYLRQ